MINTEVNETEALIQQYQTEKVKLKQELIKLQTDAGQKFEQFSRLSEKRRALKSELDQKNKALQKTTGVVEEKMNQETNNNKKSKKDHLKEKFEQSEERQSIRENFQAKLLNKIDNVYGDIISKNYEDLIGKSADSGHAPKYQRSQALPALAVAYETERVVLGVYDDEEEHLKQGEEKEKGLAKEKIKYMTTYRCSARTDYETLYREIQSFFGCPAEELEMIDEKNNEMEKHSSKRNLEKHFKGRDFDMKMVIVRSNKRELEDLEIQMDKNKEAQKEKSDGADSVYELYKEKMPRLMNYIPLNKARMEQKKAYLKTLTEPGRFGETNCCVNFIIYLMLLLVLVLSIGQIDIHSIQYTVSDLNRITRREQYFGAFTLRQILETSMGLTDFFFNEGDLEISEDELNQIPITLFRPLTIRQWRSASMTCPLAATKDLECFYPIYETGERDISDIPIFDLNAVYAATEEDLEGAYGGEATYTPLGKFDQTVIFDTSFKENTTRGGDISDYGANSYRINLSPEEFSKADFALQLCLLFMVNDDDRAYCKSKVNEFLCFDDDKSCPPNPDGAGRPPQGNREPEIPQDTTTHDKHVMYNYLIDNVNNNYISGGTRAVQIGMDVVDASKKYFYMAETLMEFSDFGQIVPYFDRIYFYTAQFEDMHEDAQVIKVFLGLFATFLLFFIIYNIATTGVGSKLNVYYIFSFQGIQNMMIMVLSYLVIDWIDKYDGLNISKDFLIENPDVQYLATRDLAEQYDQIRFVISFLMCILIIRAGMLFRLSPRIEIILASFENGIPQIGVFAIYFVPLLFTLNFLSQMILGFRMINQAFFQLSLISMVQSMLGITGFELYSIDGFNAFYMLIVIFVLSLFLRAGFAAIFSESYRKTMLDYGLDFLDYSWTRSQWTKWFFVWVPRYCIELRNKAKQGGGAALGGLKDGLAGLGGKIKLKEKLNCKKQCKSCVKSMKGCFEYVKNPKKCCGKKQKDEKQKDKAAKGDEEDNTKLQDNGNGKTAEANGKQN